MCVCGRSFRRTGDLRRHTRLCKAEVAAAQLDKVEEEVAVVTPADDDDADDDNADDMGDVE